MDLIIDLNEHNGQTFVIVTHDHGVAARTQRIIRMQDGEITSDEPVASAASVPVPQTGAV